MRTNTSWAHVLVQESQELMDWLVTVPTARRLLDGSIDAASYAHYLAQMYHYVRWTTPLVAHAGRRINQLRRHPALAELLIQKASEAREHEQLLLADLRNLGWTVGRVETTAPSPSVAACVAWNRFMLETGVPTAFLGTFYVLGALHTECAGIAVERLLARGTISNIRKASTFLIAQSVADNNSTANLAAVLRALSDPEEQEAILISARMTRAICVGLFQKPALRDSTVDLSVQL
jgi:hypothetical protein